MSVFYVHDITQRIVTPLDRRYYVRGIPSTEAVNEVVPVHDDPMPPNIDTEIKDFSHSELRRKRQQASNAYQEYESLPEDGELSLLRVNDIMSRDVVLVDENRSLQYLWDTMQTKQIGHVAVTADDGFLTGFVSVRDLAMYLMESELQDDRRAAIRHLCERKLVSTSAHTFIDSIVNYFFEHRVEGLPVTSNGALVGVVTMKDVLKQVLTNTTNTSA